MLSEADPDSNNQLKLETGYDHGQPLSRVDSHIWNEAQPTETARWSYTSSKTLSHADAKLFYQRHKLEELQQDDDAVDGPTKAPAPFSDVIEEPSGLGSSVYDHSDPDEVFSKNASSGIYSGSLILDGHAARRENSPPLDLNEFDAYGKHLCTGSLGGIFTPHRVRDENTRSNSDAKPDDSIRSTSSIAPEMRNICTSIKKVLDIRRKNIKISLQRSMDNPKNNEAWGIYPPPPEPVWEDNKNQPSNLMSGKPTPAASKTITSSPIPSSEPRRKWSGSVDREITQQTPVSPIRKPRKPGQDIGEDFEFSDLLPLPDHDNIIKYKLDASSIYQIHDRSPLNESDLPLIKVPSLRDFYADLEFVKRVSSDGPGKSFAFRELDILEGKFNLYFLVNEYEETATCKKVPHRDFYNVRKVDTHVHHSACMNQKHLLRFIKSKMKKSPQEIVLFRDGKTLTLSEVFESINLTAYDLSIDTLDMHVCYCFFISVYLYYCSPTSQAHTDSFHRFDKFNLKYNPVGESRLREIFLKTSNYIRGRYLAELTKEVITDLESSKYQMVEWRLSIYGKSLDEWDKLAAWVIDNKLISHNVRWLIQIPRLYHVYKAEGLVDTFEQIVINVFQPLFEVTENPCSHPKLHVFLQRVVGFDSVDDESKAEPRFHRKFPTAKEWDTLQNPPYTYWIYYLFANMTSLNSWRKRRDFNTFVLRPHCGEAGDLEHLAAAVICCHSISHGLLLRKAPFLQYIFYLDQIGIAMSPLSNNALFITYERNPFPKYFRRGLNVSLSTDDPLQFAFTKEPLIEEYSVAAQIYKLSAVDMCELAKHSVMQSGFEHQIKQRWLGPDYHLSGVRGNNVAKSNVPDIREKFRHDALQQQLAMLSPPLSKADSPPQLTQT